MEKTDAGRHRGQEEKGTTEDEKVGWHHHLNEHEFDQALGVGDGQGSLASMLQCQGPAPVESGISKGRRLRRSGYDRIKDIKSG